MYWQIPMSCLILATNVGQGSQLCEQQNLTDQREVVRLRRGCGPPASSLRRYTFVRMRVNQIFILLFQCMMQKATPNNRHAIKNLPLGIKGAASSFASVNWAEAVAVFEFLHCLVPHHTQCGGGCWSPGFRYLQTFLQWLSQSFDHHAASTVSRFV